MIRIAATERTYTIELTTGIRLASGREIPVGTRWTNAIQHPAPGKYSEREPFLVRRAFESLGIQCSLTVFRDECRIIN